MEMRFEINMDVLKQWCDIVMAFDDEVKIMIDNNKWSVKKPDPAHVSMVDTDIPISAFEIFNTGYPDDVINKSPIEIGTDLVKLSDFLKVFNANQRKKKNVIIEYDLEEKTFSYIIGQLTRSGEMLDPENIVDTKVPNYNWNIQIDTTAEEVLRAINAAKKTVDFVIFTQQNGSFQIHAQDGNDTTVFPFPDSTITGQYEGYNAKYSLNYLHSMLKEIKKGNIRINTGTDEPLRIDYIKNADIRFALMMAPRIEADDDSTPAPTTTEEEEPQEQQEEEEVPELEPIPEEVPEAVPEPEPEPIQEEERVIELYAEDIQVLGPDIEEKDFPKVEVPEPEPEQEPTEPVNVADDLKVMGDEHNENDDDTDKIMIVNVNTNEVLELIRKGHSGYWVRTEDGTEEFWKFEYAEPQPCTA